MYWLPEVVVTAAVPREPEALMPREVEFRVMEMVPPSWFSVLDRV